MDLNLLTVFEAVWEERHLSRAAERLGMTQSAASQALGRLRVTFEDELFLRTRKGMLPTPRAEALAGPVTDSLDQLREAMTPPSAFDPASSDRTFKIAFARYGELNLLPTLLNAVGSHRSNIKVVSHAGDRGNGVELVTTHAVDFGFDYQQPSDSRLASCLFEHEEMVVITRRDHPRLQGHLSKAQYFNEQHVILSVSDQRRALLEKVLSRENAARRILAEADQAVALPALVMETDALATVPRSVAQAMIFSQQVDLYELPVKVPSLPVYMFWHRLMESDPGHIWMKAQLLDCRARKGNR